MSDLSPGVPAQPNQPAQPPKPGGGCGIGCLGIVGFVVILVAILAIVGSCSNKGGSSESSNKYESIAQCEARVKEQLKAPSTAKFETDATGSGANWTVTGTVDAQNGFGAMLRSSFQCTVVVHEKTATTKIDFIK